MLEAFIIMKLLITYIVISLHENIKPIMQLLIHKSHIFL